MTSENTNDDHAKTQGTQASLPLLQDHLLSESNSGTEITVCSNAVEPNIAFVQEPVVCNLREKEIFNCLLTSTSQGHFSCMIHTNSTLVLIVAY